jgi:class 3 adenylate cyclase
MVVNRYGGEVDRYDESSMVVLFGARVTHEDDPERGVLAAMAIKGGLEAQIASMEEGEPELEDEDIRQALAFAAANLDDEILELHEAP